MRNRRIVRRSLLVTTFTYGTFRVQLMNRDYTRKINVIQVIQIKNTRFPRRNRNFVSRLFRHTVIIPTTDRLYTAGPYTNRVMTMALIFQMFATRLGLGLHNSPVYYNNNFGVARLRISTPSVRRRGRGNTLSLLILARKRFLRINRMFARITTRLTLRLN